MLLLPYRTIYQDHVSHIMHHVLINCVNCVQVYTVSVMCVYSAGSQVCTFTIASPGAGIFTTVYLSSVTIETGDSVLVEGTLNFKKSLYSVM
jgi:hypothetical protein